MPRVEIETPRLRLRPWAIDDWKLPHRAYGDPEVARWIGTDHTSPEWTAYAVGRMTSHWELRGYGSWALEELGSGEFVGRAGLSFQADWPVGEDKVEVGWTLVRAQWADMPPRPRWPAWLTGPARSSSPGSSA